MSDNVVDLKQLQKPTPEDDDRIDISGPLTDLCDALGVDKNSTAELRLEPFHAVVILYEKNENGGFVRESDGGPKVRRHVFRVKT